MAVRLSGLAKSAETPAVHMSKFSQDLLASVQVSSSIETCQPSFLIGEFPVAARITTRHVTTRHNTRVSFVSSARENN